METDILQTIRAEHDVIRALQELVVETEGGTGARQQLWFRLKTELTAHARAEEAALYDMLARDESTRELACHSIEEHDTIDEIMSQLDHIGFDQPQWKRTLDRLIEVIDHHLAEEEVELFPVAGRTLSDTQRQKAARRYRVEKQTFINDQFGDLVKTTHTGFDGRTYESRPLGDLRALAEARGIEDARTMGRSALISELREAPEADV